MANHIYIHIPYCRRKCIYCNFFSVMNASGIGEMADLIVGEAGLRKESISPEISSVYFGGGTPSLLPARDIDKILQAVSGYGNITAKTEITLEINPEDAGAEKIRDWVSAGINRYSIGLQSLNNKLLASLGRTHDAGAGTSAVKLLQKAGIENISVDFIFGLPEENENDLLKNLRFVSENKIPHLSAYSLTVEEKTVLQQAIKKGRILPPDEEQNARFYEIIMNWAVQNDFHHYEISNFARWGFESRHNSAYWSGKEYVGFGPGAHSYLDGTRSWNVESILKYKEGILNGTRDFGFEVLTETEKINEYIINRIRTSEGINLDLFRQAFGNEEFQSLLQRSGKVTSESLVVVSANTIVLSRQGRLMADHVCVELMKGE